MLRYVTCGALLCVALGCAKGKTPPEPTRLVTIPAGQFQFGTEVMCNYTENVGAEEKDFCGDKAGVPPMYPQVTVELPEFQIEATEVTNLQYLHCVESGPCSKPKFGNTQNINQYWDNEEYYDFPVVNVTWEQANQYCQWLGRRLPTEFEWERAAKAETAMPWGETFAECKASDKAKQVAINGCKGDVTDPRAVGSMIDDKVTVADGDISDLGGNVSEWVDGLYKADITCGASIETVERFAPVLNEDEKFVCGDSTAEVEPCRNAQTFCSAGTGQSKCIEKQGCCDGCTTEGGANCFGLCVPKSSIWVCVRREGVWQNPPLNTGAGDRMYRGGNYLLNDKTKTLCQARPTFRGVPANAQTTTIGFRCAQ